MIPHAGRRSPRFALGMCLLAAAQGCSTRYLPPPTMPKRVMPVVTDEPPPLHADEGAVTLDVVSGHARVEVVTGRAIVSPLSTTGFFTPRGTLAPGTVQSTTRPLCVTPCTVGLPLGFHELQFFGEEPGSTRTGTAHINVTPHPSVVRHAMGHQENHAGGLAGGIVVGAVGVSAMIWGSVLLAFSGAASSSPPRTAASSSPSHTDFAPAGGITLGVGAVLTTLGIIIGLNNRPEVQPGATIQWTPPPGTLPSPTPTSSPTPKPTPTPPPPPTTTPGATPSP